MISYSTFLYFFLFLVIIIWLGYLTLQLRNYTQEKKELLDKAKKAGLDTILNDINKNLKKLNSDTKELYQITDDLSKIAAVSVTKVGLIRFNPFNGDGGDQSFSIALLNSQNDGFVITSLHNRQETRIFAKPVEKGSSSYHLSQEEIKALTQANATPLP